MFSLLAQATETTTKTVIEPAYHFSASAWAPSADQLVRGGVVTGGIALAGLIFLPLIRRYLTKARLIVAYLVAVIAMALYFGAAVVKPDRFADPLDTASFWLHRAFYAAWLFVAIRIVDRLIVVPLMTRGGKVPLQRFVHQIAIIVIGVFAVLGFGSYAFGWDIDKFLAGSAVVSIVLGLALQETLGNFFSGLVMHASSPFAIGNWIVVAGVEGRVVDMNWRAVTIHTSDDNFVLIPNSTIAKEQITNFHAPTISTACNVRIFLESELIPCEVIETFARAMKSATNVLKSPEPKIRLEKFEGSMIQYGIKFWIDNPSRHVDIEHEVRLAIWYEMRRAGYTIPYTSSNIEVITSSRKAKAVDEAGVSRRLRVIESIPLLSPLTPEHKEALAAAARDALLAPSQILFRQGDSGDSFYVIHKGNVDVMIGDTPETQKSIATLGPGDFFGEMSALTGQPRTATIRARDALTAVEIDKRALDSLFTIDPSIMERISQVVTKRNVEREAARKGLSEVSTQEVVEQQRSLLGRMLRFFGREK